MDKDVKRRLVLIFGFVLIDLLGYSLILPLLPYYAEAYGATVALVGLLGTSNALAQLIASPFIGRFSDRFGRRPLLIFCIVGTVLGFLLLALARSVPMLFISRVLDGFLGGNTSLARAYISDVTDEKNRSRGLGIIGAAFGLGFTVGPAMGGLLSRLGYSVPAFVAAGLSALNLIAVLIWLPESLPPERRGQVRQNPRTAITAGALWEALHRPCSGPLLGVGLFFSLAFTLFQSNFALYAKEHLGLDVQSTSFVLTYVGILSVLVQGFAIGKLTDRFSERRLISMAILILIVAFVAWGFAPNVWVLLIVLAPIALAAGVLGVAITSQLTKSVYQEEVGGTLGLSASLQTLSQIVTPGLGGLLLGSIGTWSLGVLAGLIMVWTFAFARRRVFAVSEEDMVGCRGMAASLKS
jgi:DHA1 family tetracycline resistance protein-like MFS transporter